MGTEDIAENTQGASTTKGLLPLEKVLSGWGRRTTAIPSAHTRLGRPRGEENTIKVAAAG